MGHIKQCARAILDTPLGQMLAVGDEEFLYFLKFVDQEDLEHDEEILEKQLSIRMTTGSGSSIRLLESDLSDYFAGRLEIFKTAIRTEGSPFQKRVWDELKKIPVGETRSYLEVATEIGNPAASRAVALANRSNPLSLIIPCHRVIHQCGTLSGYRGGVDRKKWLLSHEKRAKQ